MKKILYLDLQKKYAGSVVALDKSERRVLVSGKDFPEIFRKLSEKNIRPETCVFVGPIQKYGTINVYCISLREEGHRWGSDR